MLRRGKRLSVLAVLAIGSVFGVGLAHAELVERGNLFVKFSGGIAPDQPAAARQRSDLGPGRRHGQDPLGGAAPGAALDLDRDQSRRQGRNQGPAGLPTAARSRRPARRRRWRPAAGRWSAAGATSPASPSPNRRRCPLQGKVLAFNAVADGKRAILAHVYGCRPVPNSRTFVFHIHKSQGTYGTVLTAALPDSRSTATAT